MLSQAYTHYPQFRFRDGQKLLWNPVLKKTFKNRPEERVRMQLIDYLVLEAGFSSKRLSFESPVKLEGEKSLSRTDIIGYGKDFEPVLLVECKAPDIRLDEKAALQIARYNYKVGAPFLLVSNGMLDFWFEVEGDSIHRLTKIPELFAPSLTEESTAEYWTKRAFIGNECPSELAVYLSQSCRTLFTNPLRPLKYLNFEGLPPQLALTHYYRIFPSEKDAKIALSISANHLGGTRLNAILNANGENTAFLSASLDLILKKEADNTHLQSAKGTISLDLASETNFDFETNIEETVSTMMELLIENS